MSTGETTTTSSSQLPREGWRDLEQRTALAEALVAMHASEPTKPDAPAPPTTPQPRPGPPVPLPLYGMPPMRPPEPHNIPRPPPPMPPPTPKKP